MNKFSKSLLHKMSSKGRLTFAITVLILSVSLSGCGATLSNGTLAVPDVVEYTPAQQDKAADELEKNNVPMLTEFMKDYSVMRDQARAAKDKPKWYQFWK